MDSKFVLRKGQSVTFAGTEQDGIHYKDLEGKKGIVQDDVTVAQQQANPGSVKVHVTFGEEEREVRLSSLIY